MAVSWKCDRLSCNLVMKSVIAKSDNKMSAPPCLNPMKTACANHLKESSKTILLLFCFLNMCVKPRLLQQRMIGNVGPKAFRHKMLRKTAINLNDCDGLCFHDTHDMMEFYQLKMSSESHDITQTVLESDLRPLLLQNMIDMLTNISLIESFITFATVLAPSLLMLVDQCCSSAGLPILSLLCDIAKHIEEIDDDVKMEACICITHCGQVISNGNTYLGQHWLR